MKMRPLVASLLITGLLLPLLTHAAEEGSGPVIKHIPIPVAFREQPIPITATVTSDDSEIVSVVLRHAQTKVAMPSSTSMEKVGPDKYRAVISGRQAGTAPALVYFIEAVDADGNASRTIWYPIKIEDFQQKVKTKSPKSAEKAAAKQSGRVSEALSTRPITSFVGAVAAGATVQATINATRDDGNGGSSSSSGTLTGTWLVSEGGSTFTMILTQTDTSLSGSMPSTPSGPTTITGYLCDDGVVMNVRYTNYGITDTWVGTKVGRTMSGTWRDSWGNSGPWSAEKQ